MVGIFDSGSGGLTVLQALRDVLPSCDVLYFGDIKNAPYGSRSRAELSKLTVEAIRLLQERGAARLVSACNSLSASLALSVFDIFSLDQRTLVEMVGPTVAAFKDSPARILLCATPATVDSGIYQTAFTMIGKNITALAIPALAGAIEFGAPQEELRRIIAQSLSAVALENFDTLILACTHYPLVIDLFREAAPGIELFDPARAVAERVAALFWPQEVGNGATRYLISKESAPFCALVARLFPGTEDAIEVVE